MLKIAIYTMSLFCLVACGDSKERIPYDAPGYVDGKPVHPTIKIGRPYRVKGEKYYPEYDPDYDEEGLASWYGPNFHGKSTANGERFNQWAMTAAHKTLPMPSIVRVTHKENGRSIVVRINDRGPFVDDRIIDLSRAAAEELGIIGTGTAPVRVEYLKPDTEQYIARLQLKKPHEWTQKDIQIAKAEERVVEIQEHAPVAMVKAEPLLPIQEAEQVPELFAFNSPMKEPTTLNVRGVVMEEIGYAEDAFSVLEEEDYGYFSAHAKPAKTVSYAPSATSSYAPVATYQEPVALSSYFVQVGLFSDRENAYSLSQKLSALSKVDVSPMPSSGRTLYRVRMGPIDNQSDASQLVERVRQYDIFDAKIVKE